MGENAGQYKTRLKLRHISTPAQNGKEVNSIEHKHGCTFDNDDILIPGDRIRIERMTYFNPDYADLTELLSKSVEELGAIQRESVKKEGVIRDKLSTVADEWQEQAAYTKLLGKAMEYLEMAQVKHTSNEWVTNDRGEHEISNLVYLMRYSISPKLEYGRRKGILCDTAWYVSWYFCYNRPHRGRRPNPLKLEWEVDKRFSDESRATKYIQNKVEQYAAKFTELSPPIPEDDERVFYCNGRLLPGYTVAPHEPTPDELLDFIGDGDLSAGSADKEQQQEKAPEQPAKKSGAKKKPGHAR